MNIQYQLRGLHPRTLADHPLDRPIEALGRLILISCARVVLEHQPNTAPAFCVAVDLAVPGPDIHAAARDHTLPAAMTKVIRRLEEQIAARKDRQQRRHKRHEHCRGVASQWSR